MYGSFVIGCLFNVYVCGKNTAHSNINTQEFIHKLHGKMSLGGYESLTRQSLRSGKIAIFAIPSGKWADWSDFSKFDGL